MEKNYYVWYVVESGYERTGLDGYIRPVTYHYTSRPLRLHTDLKNVFLELDKTLDKDLAILVKEEFGKIKNKDFVNFTIQHSGVDGTDLRMYCLHKVDMYYFMRQFRDSADQWIKEWCKSIMNH